MIPFLDPFSLNTIQILTRLSYQPGKRAIDLIIDFLAHMWEYAKEQITREIGAVADLS